MSTADDAVTAETEICAQLAESVRSEHHELRQLLEEVRAENLRLGSTLERALDLMVRLVHDDDRMAIRRDVRAFLTELLPQ